MKQGLVLDKVVLLGRTLDEYRRYFALDLDALRGRRILDVASGRVPQDVVNRDVLGQVALQQKLTRFTPRRD